MKLKSILAAGIAVLALGVTAPALADGHGDHSMMDKAAETVKEAAYDMKADAKDMMKAHKGAVVGEPAPNVTFTDTNGVEHTIAGFAGKTVVLEWTNPECPFDKKHYETGNMQKLQKEATDMGAIWVAVNSGGEGKQGSYATDEAANADNKAKGFAGTAYVRDVAGEFGKTFGAKTTPHMYVINPEGVLAYAGAIDSIPSAQFEDVEKAENYVMAAVKAIAAGEEVSPSSTQPYGCSVKYAN